MMMRCVYFPYSGKFLLVQNFTELPVSPWEEIFVVLNSCRDQRRPEIFCYTYIFYCSSSTSRSMFRVIC